jgi:hypothetical protein
MHVRSRLLLLTYCAFYLLANGVAVYRAIHSTAVIMDRLGEVRGPELGNLDQPSTGTTRYTKFSHATKLLFALPTPAVLSEPAHVFADAVELPDGAVRPAFLSTTVHLRAPPGL